ncbi:hypothetical protein HYDPIDRAFT_33277 [Hydnomerulius pinastri MD-312]|uniref:DUF6830 domain-containing protein n=1 Tax=Hydnomerulius pinastri MD-312 TaxID=994086 RepID=A0A0C9W0F6_9AGAM|nr:hypothetical protein HYDPIDRAFT_33277 [Hydnomerulius pinastri MD-312]
MQNIALSIKHVGVTIQWTADITKHAHISEIKTPAGASNNNNYNPQISLHKQGASSSRPEEGDPMEAEECNDNESCDGADDEAGALAAELPVSTTLGLAHPVTDYFAISARLRTTELGTVPLPLRSFSIDTTAIHLSYDPSLQRITVDNAAEMFSLPDLRAALADFLNCEKAHGPNFVHTISGQRHSSSATTLPFTEMQAQMPTLAKKPHRHWRAEWSKIRMPGSTGYNRMPDLVLVDNSAVPLDEITWLSPPLAALLSSSHAL